MDALLGDLRYAFRMLVRSPGLTAVAVLSLALGIGLNTTIFSLVNALLLRPLPAERPAELVSVYTSRDGQGHFSSSYPDYIDFRNRNTVFVGLASHAGTEMAVTVNGEASWIAGAVVSGHYLPLLGVRPFHGRFFLPEEDRTPGTHPVAVLGHRLWRSRFGGDPGIVGRPVRLNGTDFTVLGIAPPEFTGTSVGFAVDVFVPNMMHAAALRGAEGLGGNWRGST